MALAVNRQNDAGNAFNLCIDVLSERSELSGFDSSCNPLPTCNHVSFRSVTLFVVGVCMWMNSSSHALITSKVQRHNIQVVLMSMSAQFRAWRVERSIVFILIACTRAPSPKGIVYLNSNCHGTRGSEHCCVIFKIIIQSSWQFKMRTACLSLHNPGLRCVYIIIFSSITVELILLLACTFICDM